MDETREVSRRHFDRIFGPSSSFETLEEKLGELLRLMADDTPELDGQTLSWHAFRVAEMIDDPRFLPHLRQLLENRRDEDTKCHLYTVIGHIGRNADNHAAAEILLNRIGFEHTKFTLMWLLDAIADQEGILECRPILRVLGDKRWMVRHAAIGALGACRDPRAEAALIRVLEQSKDPSDLIYANAALGRIGTRRAVAALARHIHHRKDDVKASAIYALARIGNTTLTPLFLDALGDRSQVAKGYAVNALYQHGDSSAVPAVCARIKDILKRDRKTRTMPKTELMVAVEFILRFRHDEEVGQIVEATLDWLRPRVKNLFAEEQEWLAAQLSGR
jgi:HEAT repeat protein